MSRFGELPLRHVGLLARLTFWFSKRLYGKVVGPLAVTAHHRWILSGSGAYELALGRARLFDARLKALAEIKAAALVGCPF